MSAFGFEFLAKPPQDAISMLAPMTERMAATVRSRRAYIRTDRNRIGEWIMAGTSATRVILRPNIASGQQSAWSSPLLAMVSLVAGALILLPGCSRGATPAGDSIFAMAAKPATGALPAADVLPDEAALSLIYDDADGEKITIKRCEPDHDGLIELSRHRAGETAPFRIDRVRWQHDGSIVLIETETRGEKVLSRYDPPLILMPARLAPNEPHVQQVHLTVHPLKNPKRISHQGPAENTLLYAGRQRIRTQSGAFEAARVEAKFTANLGLAQVNNETISLYAPSVGLVAERGTEQAKTFGIAVKNDSWEFVLSER